jgi:predicted secreted hydrolase
MRRAVRIAILSLGVVGAAFAANVGETLSFPRDHGSHPDAAIEWWYYTGHLQDAERNEYGFQVTFFRVRELHLAHFAWSDVRRQTFEYAEKTHLGLPGIAAAAADRLDVSNEDWSVSASGERVRLHVRARFGELELDLAAVKAPVLNGPQGISRKGAGVDEYSHYVSVPRWKASGSFQTKGRRLALSGNAWFDHEWGPGVLSKEARGWDWFGLQLDDGSDLMLYRIRGESGQATPFSAGTFSPSQGPASPISWSDVAFTQTGEWKSPHSGARYPSKWNIQVRSLDLDLEIEPQLPDQELITQESTGVIYWEGTCRVRGKRDGRAVTGRAYAELTGYARRDVPGFEATGGAGGR